MKEIETIGVVLLNLGGPDSLKAVKPFLYNLFSDREIIRLGPDFMQKPIARLISTLRSSKSRQMYSFIGGKSPLLDITTAQAEALEKALNQKSEVSNSLLSTLYSLRFKVYIGMRYSPPFIKDVVNEILRAGIKHLIVLPLYPHYSKTTTGSAIAEFKRAIAETCPPTLPSPSRGEGKGGGEMGIHYIEHWYDFPPYIEALAELIAKGVSELNGQLTRATDTNILYSAHSLPESFIKEGDPYLDHINATITAVNSLLSTLYSLPCRWHLSFQSRAGRVKWLKPSTEETIVKLAKDGCKNLLIVPISFVSDNIETLYEIGVYYRDIAIKHGVNLRRCQSLNISEKFINTLKELVMKAVGNGQ